MIVFRNINKAYPTKKGSIQALSNINLQVDAGEIFGIIGQSGAGKSTLIRCGNLLEQPDSGQVIIDQQNLTQLSRTDLRQARRKTAMIFQHFNLLSSRTVFDNIALPLELLNESKQAIKSTIMPLLELTGLTDKKNVHPAQLSGGQKQRVAIARALASKPKVLLCDEATSALDPQTTQSILELLKNINQEFNITILLITHEMEVIKHICHKVALLDAGKIVEQNKVADFFIHPQTELAKSFIHTTLRQELPEAISQRLITTTANGNNPVIRVSFHGAVTSKPLISHLVKEYGVEANILQAEMEFIQNEAVGTMILEFSKDKGNIEQGLAYLKAQNLQTEVIGYVAADAPIRT